MHPLLLPLGLLLFAALHRGNAAAAKAQAVKPKAKAKAKASPATPPPPPDIPRAIASRVPPKAPPPPTLTPEHPDVTPAPSAQQAAVDHAVNQAVMPPPPLPPVRTPEQAAKDLLSFLIQTQRYGSKTDRPAEVIAAQHDMGVTADGIVGKGTRAAALRYGVAIPPPQAS
jgi:peptidoglycan hydrolase-like protein with peptidoglycan-binding domain